MSNMDHHVITAIIHTTENYSMVNLQAFSHRVFTNLSVLEPSRPSVFYHEALSEVWFLSRFFLHIRTKLQNVHYHLYICQCLLFITVLLIIQFNSVLFVKRF